MKLVVWKNHLGGQILYKSLDPAKKTASMILVFFYENIMTPFLGDSGLLYTMWTPKWFFDQQNAVLKCVFMNYFINFIFSSLKNPSFPEFVIPSQYGIMSLAVHEDKGYLTACGLYDGSVALFNVKENLNGPIFITSSSNRHTQPVWSVNWLGVDEESRFRFCSISTDGHVRNIFDKKQCFVNFFFLNFFIINLFELFYHTFVWMFFFEFFIIILFELFFIVILFELFSELFYHNFVWTVLS
mgnify:CR=1 FL=1